MSGAAKNSSSTSDSEPVGLSASILAESRPSRNFSFAAKVRAQGDGTFRKPSLIGGCVSNVGFPVLSRPSPESTDGRAQVGASITANFVFGSTIEIRMEKAVDVVAVGMCGNSRQRVIHISTAAAVIFLGLQVA
ncbi:MAG: hypothetical protein V3R90_11165 [Limibaculum sp.]